MIPHEPDFVFLTEQLWACERALRKAYRAYYARLAGQETGEASVVDSQEIHPLEAEYRRITQSLTDWLATHPEEALAE